MFKMIITTATLLGQLDFSGQFSSSKATPTVGVGSFQLYVSESLKTCKGCHQHGQRRSDFEEKKNSFGCKKNGWKRPQVSVENTQFSEFCPRCS